MAPPNFALKRHGTGIATLQSTPIPKLPDDYILVRTVAIALNPTDYTTLDAKGADGPTIGCDYAGVVEAVGPAVKRNFKKGDRVAGFAHGENDANFDYGAFARYIIVKGDLQLHISDSVSFEEACTLGVAVGTLGVALYKILELPFPGSDVAPTNEPILIYGGSTATGTVAVQFAKMSGYHVITTCSPKHFDMLRARGADEVYDYRTTGIGKHIRESTKGKITKVLDCVALESSAAICADAFGPTGGVYCNLLDVNRPRPDVKSVFFLGYALSGEPYTFEGEDYPVEPGYYEFGVKWIERADKIWAERGIKAHPQRIGKGGLIGALNGLQIMREGKVSGEKLVYCVEETEWPFS